MSKKTNRLRRRVEMSQDAETKAVIRANKLAAELVRADAEIKRLRRELSKIDEVKS